MATRKHNKPKPHDDEPLREPLSVTVGNLDEAFDGHIAFRELPSVCALVAEYAKINKMTESHAARAILRVGLAAVITTRHEGVLR